MTQSSGAVQVTAHLCWPILPPVSLKLRVARSVVQHGRPIDTLLADKSIEGPLEILRKLIDSRAPVQRWAPKHRGEPEAVDTLAPLDGYNARVRAAFEEDLEEQVSVENRDPTVTELLLDTCGSKLCSDCTKLAPNDVAGVCAWTEDTVDNDAETLEQRGLCLRPALELFEFCSQVAHDAYTPHWPGSRRTPEVRFQTQPLATSNARLDLALDGTTKEASVGTAQSPVRVVTALFHGKELWLQDYLSLPYVLSHECIAHAWCGRWLHESDASRSGAFHDGWMDRIALEVLADSVPRMNSAESIVSNHWDDFYRAGREAQTKRMSRGRHTVQKINEWAAGQQALHAFAGLLNFAKLDVAVHSEPVTPADVHSEVLAVSLALNASDLTHLERRDFVFALLAHFSFNSDERRARALASPRVMAVVVTIQRYLVHRDVVQMVREIVSVPSN